MQFRGENHRRVDRKYRVFVLRFSGRHGRKVHLLSRRSIFQDDHQENNFKKKKDVSVGRAKPEIAFLDLEACGLNATSWPIEVGFCFETRNGAEWLIAPHEDWPMAS